MHGNVVEWAQGEDGQPITCGGSFEDAASALTCSSRQRQTERWTVNEPEIPLPKWWLSDGYFVGFRIVRDF